MTDGRVKKILLTGANGQLGWEIQKKVQGSDNVELYALSRQELDIVDKDDVLKVAADIQPDAIVNASAYTAVDKAESDVEMAKAINTDGARNLAIAASQNGARLVHVSTDYVFDGMGCLPYKPDSETSPNSVYGHTKLDGENAVIEACPDAIVIRTAWVYSAHGNNFVKTMLRLMEERDELGVVADQIGTPTWASNLAEACLNFAVSEVLPESSNVYHWTDLGVASWYDFAKAIYEIGHTEGLITAGCDIKPIETADYPTPAKRPAYSVLDKKSALNILGVDGQYWRDALQEMIKELMAKELVTKELITAEQMTKELTE